MGHAIRCDFKHDMFFEADIDGYKIGMDSSPEFGGKNLGPPPKPLVLVALSGCTGMDVVTLLNKMQVAFSSFKLYVTGSLTDEKPQYYNEIHVIYEIGGKNLAKANVEKAVRLSQEKYCGVTAGLRKMAKITYEIKYIE